MRALATRWRPRCHGPGGPQAPRPGTRPAGDGARLHQRYLRLAAGRSAWTRYPPRPGRVDGESRSGRTLPHRRSVPSQRLGGGCNVVGYGQVQGGSRTGGGLPVGAHCQEGRLAPLRAGTGSPGVLAWRAWPQPAPTALRGRQVEQDVEVVPRRASPTRARRVRWDQERGTHTDDEWPEQVALEHLAVLSVVARWADETKVITGSEAPR